MEYLVAFCVTLGLSGPLVWVGDKTGNDTLNKIGFAIFGIGLLAIYIYASLHDGGRMDPADFYRP